MRAQHRQRRPLTLVLQGPDLPLDAPHCRMTQLSSPRSTRRTSRRTPSATATPDGATSAGRSWQLLRSFASTSRTPRPSSGAWRTRASSMSRRRSASWASSACNSSLPSSSSSKWAALRQRHTPSVSWTARRVHSTPTSSTRLQDMARYGPSLRTRSTACAGRSCAAPWEVAQAGRIGAGASGTPSVCTTRTGAVSGTGGPLGSHQRPSARTAPAQPKRERRSRAFVSTSTTPASTLLCAGSRGALPSASTTSGAWRWHSMTGFWRVPAEPTTLMRQTSSSCRITQHA
mmetsp:Transcript_53808/g.172507  ORF Transcript_53808/g.172507 Transcript_53808/m.172507 type:complete len:288 (-) Transcript_53808:1138-2001(-)